MVFFSEILNSPLVLLLDLGIILGSLGVVFFGRIIYSALLLGLVFVCVALLYLLLNADFLAAAQILIYVGAINVLIVFAIMLVNKPEKNPVAKQITLGDILSGFSVLGLFFFLLVTITNTSWIKKSSLTQDLSSISSFSSIEKIGIHFLTDFLLPFELLSVLLLVALAGAITIARKDLTSGIEKMKM
jgi:NAD(P)H-quinone oxidoreductase subunit 6